MNCWIKRIDFPWHCRDVLVVSSKVDHVLLDSCQLTNQSVKSRLLEAEMSLINLRLWLYVHFLQWLGYKKGSLQHNGGWRGLKKWDKHQEEDRPRQPKYFPLTSSLVLGAYTEPGYGRTKCGARSSFTWSTSKSIVDITCNLPKLTQTIIKYGILIKGNWSSSVQSYPQEIFKISNYHILN